MNQFSPHLNMNNFIGWYAASVKKSPRITNGIMTGTLFGIGDVVAQVGFDEKKGKTFDYARTARAVVYGSLIFSVVADKWYKFLNKRITVGSRSRLINTGAKVAFDQLIFAPLGIPLYYLCMSALEGRSLTDTQKKLKENYWPTLTTNWYVWPAFQMLNFSLIPVQHRLLSVNVLSIFWNTFLSLKNSRSSPDDQLPVNYPPVPE